MKRKIFRKIIIILLILLVIYWLPFGVIVLSGRSYIISSINSLPDADAVIVFGTLVNESGEITPLLQERLLAGKAILDAGKSKKIVVSNMNNAANVMAQYLYAQGVKNDLVEIDAEADKTPDTCRNEAKNHAVKRKLIFVSQGFHLPRLLYQCGRLGIEGTAFPAEKLSTIDRSDCSFLTKLRTRTARYAREAGLTWLAVLNIYK